MTNLFKIIKCLLGFHELEIMEEVYIPPQQNHDVLSRNRFVELYGVRSYLLTKRGHTNILYCCKNCEFAKAENRLGDVRSPKTYAQLALDKDWADEDIYPVSEEAVSRRQTELNKEHGEGCHKTVHVIQCPSCQKEYNNE